MYECVRVRAAAQIGFLNGLSSFFLLLSQHYSNPDILRDEDNYSGLSVSLLANASTGNSSDNETYVFPSSSLIRLFSSHTFLPLSSG